MEIVFVSNYINHHQIPFCKAMCAQENVDFHFIQTEPMEEERVRMGWQPVAELPFLKLYYEEPEACQRLIDTADVVLFGGCEEEGYVAERLRQGRPVFRYHERLYREAQWKAISPRGLLKKYKDHTRYRKAPVYLLCAGAYVPDDFHIIRGYPGKMYRWGYFPEKREYDLETLFAGKGWSGENEKRNTGNGVEAGKARNGADEGEAGKAEKGADGAGVEVGKAENGAVESDKAGADSTVPYLLWAGRWIGLKHPQMAVEAALHLKEKGIPFHLELAGGGELEGELRELIQTCGLTEEITLPGFLTPDQVRERMERADIYLVTSDRREGWGAVVNEAMNSGCAVVANHMMGSVPFLIRHGENGMIYRDGDQRQFLEIVETLAKDLPLCRRLGEKAYRTIAEIWNPENAADRLMELMGKLGLTEGRGFLGKTESGGRTAPGGIAESGGESAPGGKPETSREAESGKEPASNGKPEQESLPPGPCSPAPVIPERKMYRYLKGAGT